MDESELKKKYEASNKRAQEAEEMMRQAAQYGKTLLEKNMELEARVEEFTQEKYELTLKIQTMQGMEQSLHGELDFLRESVKLWEQKDEDKEAEEIERWSRREETWRARVVELESALVGSETREKGLVEQLVLAERQCQEAGEAMNNSIGGSTLSDEIVELQQAAVELLQEKQGLEQQLARTKAELESSKAEVQSCAARSDLLSKEIEELRCEATSYIRASENSKTEIMELEAQLEAMRVGEVDENSKGNSLFSEVNDRREKVEDQMKKFADKYATLKENYDSKVSQLQKTKMHNAQLLSIAGTMGDTNHSERLEQLLSAEREKNKELSGRLDSLEKVMISPPQVITLPSSAKADESSDCGLHTTSEEYSYLTSLLEGEQKRNQGLQSQLQQQLRQNLEDSDKLREITRKVNQSESNLQRAKADNYALKVALDDMKAKKEDHKPVKKEPKKIVEVLKFDPVPEKGEQLAEKDAFVLKEIVANNGKAAADSTVDKPPELVLMSPTEKENVSKTESGKPRKKAMFSDTVSVHDSETGSCETGVLHEESTGGVGGKAKGSKPSKPQGKRHFGAQNTVRVTGEEPAECKQQ